MYIRVWHFRTLFSGGLDLKDLFQLILTYEPTTTSEAKALENRNISAAIQLST